MKKVMNTPFCCVCGLAIRKNASAIVLLDAKRQIHVGCAMTYCIAEECIKETKESRPPNPHIRQRDFDLYFTQEYGESDKNVPLSLAEEKKNLHKSVKFRRDPMLVKILIRDTRILPSLEIKYFRELGKIHTLSLLFHNHPEKFESNFHKTFVPSVLKQFWIKGYLSDKQWNLVKVITSQKAGGLIDPYSSWRYLTPGEVKLELPDMLHIAKKKKSFVRWYNKKEGIIEKE